MFSNKANPVSFNQQIRSYVRILLSVFFISIIGLSAQADHIIGSDFSYSCSSTNDSIFNITYNFYRDCNGCYVLGQSPKCGTSENCASSSTAPTALKVTCIKGGNYTSTLTLKRTSIVDITKTCKAVKSKCAQPCNTSFPYGIEKHTFEGQLDLTQAIKNGCCNVEISALLYVRSALITTGQQQQTFYTSCEINVCDAKCNTSPTLTNDPVAILCCNQPYVFNNGAVDFADYDSISYSFAPAFRGQNQQTSYSSVRSPANPISTYYPSGLKFPYCNPNANPPIGICLDEFTGDIIFTPTKCDEIAVVVIQMTEWRKDSTGKYKVIGVTRRDMQFIVMNCPDNNPPSITNSKFTYRVCEGEQICFNVTTDDKVKKPPPPATPPDPDTVQLNWNRGIPGATFKITNPKARLKTGEFCWTPPVGVSSTLPYTFTATVNDDACPLAASATRAFQIYVDPKAETVRDVDTFDCGKYSVNSIPFPNFLYPAKYLWQILDTNGQIIFDRNIVKFQSTNSYISSKKTDTLQFRTGGTYVIQHVIENKPNCATTYYDTLVVPPLLEVDLAFGPDTFVCAGTTLRIQPKVKNEVPPVTFKWGNGDTTNYLDIQLPSTTTDSSFYVEIKDKTGCIAWDSTKVYLKQNPFASIGDDRRICTYDTINFSPLDSIASWDDPNDTSAIFVKQGDTLYKEWFLNGALISQDTTLFGVHTAGIYAYKVSDSLGCYAIDTMNLYVNDTVNADAGLDQTLCWNDYLEIVGKTLDTAGNDKSGYFQWWDITNGKKVDFGQKDTIAYNIKATTEFWLELFVTEDTTECYDSDSVLISVNPLPTVKMPNNMDVCHDAGNINLRISEDPNASGGKWYVPAKPSLIKSDGYTFVTSAAGDSNASVNNVVYYQYVHPSTGCVKTDSFVIKVNPVPKVSVRDGYFCQDKEVVSVKDDKIIATPGGATLFLGRQAWKCVNCGSYNESDIIEDLNGGATGSTQDYVLHIDKNAIPLGSKTSDKITIEFEFRSVLGCYNRDTAEITITKVPEITFDGFPDLCWDEGLVELKKTSNVSPPDGIWKAIDSTGFAKASGFNAALKGDTLNEDTLNTLATPQPAEGSSFTYVLRYSHDRSGCPTYKDTTIKLRGLPVPIIDEFPLADVNKSSEPFKFCELDKDVALKVNYSPGIWSSTNPSALSGSTFKPSSATTYNTPFSIKFDYTDIYGCKGKDSVFVEVHQKHSLEISNDTSICRYENMSVPVKANFSNATDMLWIPLTGGTVGSSSSPNTTFAFTSSTDSVTRHLLYAQTLETADNVCPFAEKTMQVFIHPKPKASITGDTLNGCVPVVVNFNTTILNKIDPATSTYAWDFAGEGTDANQNPNFEFKNVGKNKTDLKLTSAFGCDTTLTLDVDVYPFPTASFVPNPNNSTTAALPKFQFNNQSTVTNELGSKIVSYFWDFGIDTEFDDTSSEISPLYFYPADTGTYEVELTVRTQYNCEATVSLPVIIGPDILVYIPNAFSPDKSGPAPNEGFRAVVNDGAKEYHLIIFNRWGEVIWESIDKTEEWDGKYGSKDFTNREPVPQDVYAYYLQIVSWNGKSYEFSGTVTLIR